MRARDEKRLKRACPPGATLRIDGDEITVEAPYAHVWAGIDVHEVVHERSEFDNSWAPAVKAALEDMRGGVERCEKHAEGACEWCADRKAELEVSP